MKFLYPLLLPFFFSICLPAQAQSWKEGASFTPDRQIFELYTDTIANILYAGGGFHDIGGVLANGIAKWDGVSWQAVGTGVNCTQFSCPWIDIIVRYKNYIVVSGFFTEIGGVTTSIGAWDGTSWSAPFGTVSPWTISNFYVDDTLLYAAGAFTEIGGVQANGIAVWDGTSWSQVGTSLNLQSQMKDVTVFQGDVYACGGIIDGGIVGVAKWNGTAWDSVGNLESHLVQDIEVYNDELYIGGHLDGPTLQERRFVKKWNGSDWVDFGSDILGEGSGLLGDVVDLKVRENRLLVRGNFEDVGGDTIFNKLVIWNGTDWCSVGAEFESVTASDVYDDTLFAVGGYAVDHITGDSLDSLIYWNKSFSSVCPPVVGVEEHEHIDQTIAVYPNPSDGIITVSFSGLEPNQSLEVYNLMGSRVHRESLNARGTQHVDLSHLPAGMYFLSVDGRKDRTHSAVVIR